MRLRLVGSKAWTAASDAVAVSPDDMQINSLQARKGLKFYLMTESPVLVKACDNIIIDRSLILCFFNQLIPFTVMMFTTIRELERKSTAKSSNEGLNHTNTRSISGV